MPAVREGLPPREADHVSAPAPEIIKCQICGEPTPYGLPCASCGTITLMVREGLLTNDGNRFKINSGTIAITPKATR